ncbi:hypothetical protein ACHAW6_001350 [Cyclotella cf. meneghiniana]
MRSTAKRAALSTHATTMRMRMGAPLQPYTFQCKSPQRDVLVHGFWKCARGTVFDIRICNTDAHLYANTSSDKVLERTSKEKEAWKAEYLLACLLATKWDRAYSEIVNFVHVRMSLAIVRSNTLLLQGNCTHPLCCQAPDNGIVATLHDQLCNE